MFAYVLFFFCVVFTVFTVCLQFAISKKVEAEGVEEEEKEVEEEEGDEEDDIYNSMYSMCVSMLPLEFLYLLNF